MSTNWSNMRKVSEVLEIWDDKLSESSKQGIYTNNIRSSQVMSSGWNRKERYMLEKDNMTRYIKFLSYWIKTTIHLFNFTITQKDTNNRWRGQLAAFCMRTKNKTSTNKNSKGEIIRDIPIKVFKRKTWIMRRWDCINQTYSNKDNFVLKLTRNRSREQERTSSFDYVPMFSFSNTILLRSICTKFGEWFHLRQRTHIIY